MEKIGTENGLLQAKPVCFFERVYCHVLGLCELATVYSTQSTAGHAARGRATQPAISEHVLWRCGARHRSNDIETGVGGRADLALRLLLQSAVSIRSLCQRIEVDEFTFELGIVIHVLTDSQMWMGDKDTGF